MGGGTAAFTVMATVSGAEAPLASLTVSEKTSTDAGLPKTTDGAVKLGWAVLAPASVTAAPDAWVQAKVSGNPDASVLALPSSVTSTAEVTVWSGPALATGGAAGGATCASMN